MVIEIIIIFLILFSAEFIAKGLFNKRWHEKAQDRVDGIKKMGVFWDLMSGAYGVELGPKGVFESYLTSNIREITVGDLARAERTEKNSLIKNIIKKKEWSGKNIKSLNKAIEERESIIKDCLEKNKVVFTDAKIRKDFEEIEEHWNVKGISKHYDRFIQRSLDSLTKGDKTGINLWTMLKEFVDRETDFDFDPTGNKKINFLESLKMAQSAIYEAVENVLCAKIENNEVRQTLQKALNDWQQLHMLRWCIVDHSVWDIGLNGIQRAMWRFIAVISK